jgi:hypothetical protein
MQYRDTAVPAALLLALAACGGDPGTRQAPQQETTGATTTAQIPADQLIRTADPAARSYTAADFPRVQQLAPDVYSYEQLRSAGDEQFTTVSLFVVTGDGVLVADGQGSVEETRRLVDAIGDITDEPGVHRAPDFGRQPRGRSREPLFRCTSPGASDTARGRA